MRRPIGAGLENASASKRAFPQRLKPTPFATRSTRLKPCPSRKRIFETGSVLAVFFILSISALGEDLKVPKLLPWSQQIAVRENWLEKHQQMILPMMRHNGIEMWIVANEEFHDDPLTQYVAPPRPYAGNRDIFVFIDTGEKGLRKVAVTGYAEESVKRLIERANEQGGTDNITAIVVQVLA